MARIGRRLKETVGEERWATLRRLLGWTARSYVVVIVLGLIVGLQVAPAVSQMSAAPTRGKVAVIPLSGGIDGGNAASVVTRLRQARQDPEIDAVVLLINSGGGGASASEEIYGSVARTAEEMPVVVSINAIAASGAYYAAAPADVIYTKPASFVGSIGVFFVAPQSIDPLGRLITTGPNKLSGSDRRGWQYKIEATKRAFVGAVVENRRDAENPLELSREQISYASLYTGSEAVNHGLADRVGGLEDAIAAAANRADLSGYSVTILGYQEQVSFVTRTAYLASDAEDRELISPAYFVQSPDEVAIPTPLMLPRSVIQQGLQERMRENATVAEARQLAGTNTTAANATEVNNATA